MDTASTGLLDHFLKHASGKVPAGVADKDKPKIVPKIYPVTTHVVEKQPRLFGDAGGGEFLLMDVRDTPFADGIHTWGAVVVVSNRVGAVTCRGMRGTAFIDAVNHSINDIAIHAQKAQSSGLTTARPAAAARKLGEQSVHTMQARTGQLALFQQWATLYAEAWADRPYTSPALGGFGLASNSFKASGAFPLAGNTPSVATPLPAPRGTRPGRVH